MQRVQKVQHVFVDVTCKPVNNNGSSAIKLKDYNFCQFEQTQKQTNLAVSEEKKGHKNGHEDDQKPSRKPSKMKVSKFSAPIVEEVCKAIKLNRKAKYSWLQDNLGVSEATIKRAINDLNELGYINKEHSKIKGEWQLLK